MSKAITTISIKRVLTLTFLIFYYSHIIAQNSQEQISSLIVEVPIEKIKFLGFKNIDELLIDEDNQKMEVSSVISNVKGQFYNYEYDGRFIIQTNKKTDIESLNTETTNNELYSTIRALEILKDRYKPLYGKLVLNTTDIEVSTINFENLTNWINVYSKIVISFNNHSNDIVKSGTYLDKSPESKVINGNSFQLYKNIAVISFNYELIEGVNREKGTFPIYKNNNPEVNKDSYYKEGLLHSIAHELIHRYIDIHNNRINSIFNYISFGNGRKNKESDEYDSKQYDLEEVITNRTLNNFFTESSLSKALLDFYKGTEDDIIKRIPNYDTRCKKALENSNLQANMVIEFY